MVVVVDVVESVVEDVVVVVVGAVLLFSPVVVVLAGAVGLQAVRNERHATPASRIRKQCLYIHHSPFYRGIRNLQALAPFGGFPFQRFP